MHCLNLQPGNVHAAMNGARHQVPFLRTIFGKERGPVVQNPALDIEPRFNHLSMNIFLDRSRDGALYLPNHAMLPLFGLHRSFSALALSLLECRAVPAKKKRALSQLIRRPFRRSLPVPHALWRGAKFRVSVLGFSPARTPPPLVGEVECLQAHTALAAAFQQA